MLLAVTINSLHTSPHECVVDAPPLLFSAFLSHCCRKEWVSQSAPSLDSCTPAVFCAFRGMFTSLFVFARRVALAAPVCMRTCLHVYLPTRLSYYEWSVEEQRLLECYGRMSINTRKDYATTTVTVLNTTAYPDWGGRTGTRQAREGLRSLEPQQSTVVAGEIQDSSVVADGLSFYAHLHIKVEVVTVDSNQERDSQWAIRPSTAPGAISVRLDRHEGGRVWVPP